MGTSTAILPRIGNYFTCLTKSEQQHVPGTSTLQEAREGADLSQNEHQF